MSKFYNKLNQNEIEIQLILKDNIKEINLIKMFSGCTNLVSVKGFKNLKDINITKAYGLLSGYKSINIIKKLYLKHKNILFNIIFY